MPIEKEVNLTGRALEIVAQHRFPLHIMTKSTRVLRDLETVRQIGQVYAAVSFIVTTADDESPARWSLAHRLRRADSGCEGGKSCSAWKCADEGGGNC